MLRASIWVESFKCAGTLRLQLQWENFVLENIWNFATFNLYTVPEKILYLQRYSTDFRNLFLSSKMLTVGTWVEIIRCTGILLLQLQGENFPHQQHLKFCHFQPVLCATKNPISPKVFNRFSKSLPQLEEVEGGHLGGKFQVCKYFTFAMARWRLGASTTFEILPHSTCTMCQQNPISPKQLNRVSKIFASNRRCWGWAFGWKVSSAQVFKVCNGNVKTLCIDNIWNFATFNMYTVAAKIQFLQRYSTDFRNLCLSSKMLGAGILVECFRCAGNLLLQWQSENSVLRQHFKFCHFQPVHSASKNPISPRVLNRIPKSLP